MKSAKLKSRGPIYRYNPETCRYERAGVSWFSLLTYTLGLALTSAVVAIILLGIHDYLIDTESERAFRQENKALQANQNFVMQELQEIETKLSTLEEKDKGLHELFFSSLYAEKISDENRHNEQKSILLSDVSGFRKLMEGVKDTSAKLKKSASGSNHLFSETFHLDNNLPGKIVSMPLSSPIGELDPTKLISGFGIRVNPFHKGLYQHQGIDLTMPRGTDIYATADGTVVTAKHSTTDAGFGNYIEIDHGNGFVTRYAHLEEIKVRPGQKIVRGTTIATSGNSGGSVAPHLHYEIIRDNDNVDPVLYMINGVSSMLHEQLRAASQKQNQSLD